MAYVPRAIHQFHGGSAVGDAITNGLLYTRGLLRDLGFTSEIYCQDVAPELAREIHAAPSFPDSEDTLLIVHFSWTIRFFDWLLRLKCRKIVVYHNITPYEFFDEGQDFERFSCESRRQLAALQPAMAGALTNSAYSARELALLGFHPIEILPLLFDPAEWPCAPYDAEIARKLKQDENFNILFVGRIVANKRQEDLLHVISRLKSRLRRPVRLLLPGGIGAGPGYGQRLNALCEELGIRENVDFTGKVSDAELRALYRGADVFLSLSQHEGFCVPIVEAMAFDLPVVAYASSAIPETAGNGGLLLDDNDPDTVAATLAILDDEPELRRRLILAGRRNLDRFERSATVSRLTRFLRETLDIQLPDPKPSRPDTPQPQWRIDGPFDSSYSLAVVNRSLAEALEQQKVDVGLHSTEGPGDFAPNDAFLAANPGVAALWQRSQSMDRPDIVLRNLYPPRVSDIHAPTRLLASWGWEESGLPVEWIAHFNQLNLITTVSRYVARILVDNGVRVPVAVVGNGAEHLGRTVSPAPRLPPAHGRFRFLHVSSAFPRKGIDVLLEAWGQAFSAADSVTLVLKTFPNPHNTVAEQLKLFRQRHPDHAEVVQLDEDVCDGEITRLYQDTQALVVPSRGEGFGLPVAEAMLVGLPVIVTAHGGALDFCSEQTAWMVDFCYRYAETHLGLFNSVWAEPIVEDLARALKEVHASSPSQRAERTERARRLVEAVFNWPAVARRTRAAVATLDHRPAIAPLPKVALVTTWNMRCGIASYARHQVCAFPIGAVQVFASHCAELLQPDEPFVERCWNQGWEDDLDNLYRAIRRTGATAVVVQFNFGFFDIEAFGRLLDRLFDDGIACHIVLHSTLDVNKPERHISLGQISASLARAARLLVHGVADLNNLKRFGLIENVAITRHGVARSDDVAIEIAQRDLGLTGKRVVACFGYLLPDKGFSVLIEAFLRLRKRHSDLHLLLINSLYPVPISLQEEAVCRALIDAHPEKDSVTLLTEYLPEESAQRLLQAANLIVFPYQQTQESSSGAVRFGLAARRPVACTPLPIFDDVGTVVHRLPGRSIDDLERGIEALLTDSQKLAAHQQRQEAWLAEHDWKAASRRLWNTLRAAPILDLVADDRAPVCNLQDEISTA